MINLKFLGTGGIGSVRLKNKLSRDYRRFCSVLINDEILIDPSQDIFEFESTFMLPDLLRGVKDVFITHSHIDRFSPLTIEKLASRAPIRVFAHPQLLEDVKNLPGVEAVPLLPFGLIRNEGYSILPLPANHSTDNDGETAYNFLVEANEETLLYALDGGWINPHAWRVLKETKLDCLILDLGAADDELNSDCVNHNNLKMALLLTELFTKESVISERTKIFFSNIPASKKRSVHEELSEAVADLPVKIAYDGYFTVV